MSMAFIKVARHAYHMCLRNQDLTIQCLCYRGLTNKELCDVRNNLQWNKARNHKPAALKAGIIVAANANQKAPLKSQESVKNLETKKNIQDSPIVPKITQEKVLPRTNSKILPITSNMPPRKVIGPLLD